ncbi:MAG: heavy metal-binding domain-containing protein [Polyangiaceae bacterium]
MNINGTLFLAAMFVGGCSAPAAERSNAYTSVTIAPITRPGRALATTFDPDTLAPSEERAPAADEGTTYTCPHHPDVASDKPGKCPHCGMPLEPKKGADHHHEPPPEGPSS